jgi:hypothetical protein
MRQYILNGVKQHGCLRAKRSNVDLASHRAPSDRACPSVSLNALRQLPRRAKRKLCLGAVQKSASRTRDVVNRCHSSDRR